MAEFDSTHGVYQEALSTLCVVAMEDIFPTEERRESAQERAFGMCVGIATMLVPGVYQTGQVPPIEVADRVCEQVMADMKAKIEKEYPVNEPHQR